MVLVDELITLLQECFKQAILGSNQCQLLFRRNLTLNYCWLIGILNENKFLNVS